MLVHHLTVLCHCGSNAPARWTLRYWEFYKRCTSRPRHSIERNGASVRSYLYAADLAGWLWAIILRGKSGSIYNVGSAQSISIHELAIQVAASLASTAQIRHGSTIESTQRFVPDVSLIANELGLVQTINLAEAIQKTASHYD